MSSEIEEPEPRSCLSQLWIVGRNGLALVAVVLMIAWLYDAISGRVSPQPEPERPATVSTVEPRTAILESVKRVNKQIFIEHYNAVDVRYTEAPEGWVGEIFNQEYVLLVRGRVPAGFDLRQLSQEDLWVSSDGTRVQLTIPAPQVFEDQVTIDTENSYILTQRDTCPGFICKSDLESYMGRVEPEARGLLVEYALRNGILEQAAGDGRTYYEQFLTALGFEEVRVIVTGYD